MAAKKKAAKAGAAAVAVKNSPYVQRLVEDEELRANICAGLRLRPRRPRNRFSNGKSPTKAVFDDKKLQKDIRELAESLRDATRRAARGRRSASAAAGSASSCSSASSARGWRWR